MAHTNEDNQQILSNLFRTEYRKITAVLCRRFGLKHIETAEDITSDTFLKASEKWNKEGIPPNPTAWLYTVAKNSAKDYLKHNTIFDTKIKHQTCKENSSSNFEFDFMQKNISDSQLSLIFVVCDPINSQESQISLVLQILFGFSIKEIALALLEKNETIKKRLHRAKKNLKDSNFEILTLSEKNIENRLNIVLKTIYLVFNEGYYSKSDKYFIRKELCLEVARLLLLLTKNHLTSTPNTNALLSLVCFQSSRFDARIDTKGDAILFEEQDRKLWDLELIERGHYYLVEACSYDEVSMFHLEAGIAYWHTTSNEKNKWKHILQLYNQLLLDKYSPIIALNRAFAFSKVYGAKEGIQEAEKLQLINLSDYYSLLGFFYTEYNGKKAKEMYTKAINLTKSPFKRRTLLKQMNKIEE